MRQASRPPLARMMVIDQAVRAGRWPNATTLAARLEVDPRTIRRDITYMRDRLGAPLEYDQNHNGYHYSAATYQLPFFAVTEGEAIALLLAGRLLGQYRGTPFEGDLRRAFAKLSELLPDAVSVRIDAIGDCLTVLPAMETDYDPKIFTALAKAAVEERRVDVVYHTADRDEATARTIDPYALFLRDDSWYAVGQDSHRAEVRVFAVQRFRSVRITGERFVRPDDFRLESYMAGSFGVVRGGGIHHVVLRFRPPTALRISGRRWHPSQITEPETDGGVILRFDISDLREVARFVMYWGDDCQIVETNELREIVRERCQTLLGP
jgi:predicted DNA-binding transcriptional regulator YafY